MHGMQGKYFNPEHKDAFYRDHYALLYQGKSKDEAISMQIARDPELEKDLYCERCFMEMQASSAATSYMILQAVRTGDEKIISAVEKRLLYESASMSNALMNVNLGLTYFEYPATKEIIKEVKQGKCWHLLNSNGLLNWEELYKYTKDKVEEMEYSKEDMYASLQTAKMLKKIRSVYKGNKEEFLKAVKNESKNLIYPHSQIFDQFVEAQRAFSFDPSKSLHQFYHCLGGESERKKMLETATEQIIPHINEYRRLFQSTIRKKNRGR